MTRVDGAALAPDRAGDNAVDCSPAAPMALTRSDGRLAGVTRNADALALAGALVFSAILVGATWGTWGDLAADTGYDLLAGARLAGGELPYRDYVYYYGPLAPFLLALFYAI